MWRILIISGFLTLSMVACDKDKYFSGSNSYQDSFEHYTTTDALLNSNEQFWSFSQLTEQGNSLMLDTTRSHSGRKSLKFQATASAQGRVSKASIAKQNMAFKDQETVRLSAWYYLEGNNKNTWLFLMDLEERTPIGAGPGMRLALVDNKLRIEYKFNEKDITQSSGSEIDFPRDQWVEVVWEVKLTRKKAGTVKLWQNGQLIINATEKVTLPRDVLYFQQGTKKIYNSCEIGITANTHETGTMLWIDDVSFQKVR